MKVRVLAAAASLAAVIAAPAMAQDTGWYGQFGLGASLGGSVELDGRVEDGPDTFTDSADLDLDNGWLVSGALGVDNGPFRIEGEIVYSDNDLEDIILEDGADTYEISGVSVSHAAVFVNALFDIETGGAWTPYIGAGVGYGGVRVSFDGEDEGDSGFAWQARAGVAIQTGSNVTWDIGYRYMDLADFEYEEAEPGFEVALAAKPTIHAVGVSARIAF